MKTKLISVIVPVFNCQNSIKKCIKSICYQDYTNLEIIIINDGSTDNSGEVCEILSKDDSRIVYVNQSNYGVSKTRNIGISMASGEYCCFVDSDDWIEENYVSKFVSAFESSSTDWVISGYTVDNANNQIRYNLGDNVYFLNELKDTSIISIFSEGYIHPCWNKMYKTQYLKRYNIFFPEDISISEDTFFNIEYLSHCNKISVINSTAYHYVKMKCSESLSQKVYENIFIIYFHIYKRLFSVLEDMNFDIHIRNSILIKMLYPQYYVSILKIMKSSNILYKQKKAILNKMLESKEQRILIKRGMEISSVRGEKIIVQLALHKHYRFLSLLIDIFMK